MKVTIDSREKGRIKPAEFYFGEKYDTQVEELTVSDYLFEFKGKTVGFEYKTMSDFFSSVIDGRVFNQAISQSKTRDYHFILIEGTEKDKTEEMERRYHYSKHHFTNRTYFGAIERLNTYTTVWFAPKMSLAFEIMENQALKCFDEKPLVKQFSKSEGNPAFRYLCYCCEEVGSERAMLITKELHLETLQDILNINKEGLMSIKGIGDKISDKIINQIKSDCKIENQGD